MAPHNYYSIHSTIKLEFSNSQIRDFSYNSFLPEMSNTKTKTKRSKVKMEKNSNSLIFSIESSDITAFRASVSDIIGLGKIIENTLNLCE